MTMENQYFIYELFLHNCVIDVDVFVNLNSISVNALVHDP